MATNVTISPDKLSSTVLEMLKEYGDEALDVQERVAQEVAEDGAKELKATRATPNDRKYHGSWGVTVQKARLGVTAVIHNKKYYRLTHLLEKGHVLRRGGRQIGTVRAFPHIAPVEQKVIAEYEKKLKEELLEGGGK